MITFPDKQLLCKDCRSTFIFCGSEQEFFALKGLINEPKRCPNCRLLYRIKKNGIDAQTTSQVMCADCGQPARVPFQPKGIRPVYCLQCLHSHKAVAISETQACASLA